MLDLTRSLIPAGPMTQLVEAGGPVMLVLIAMAVIGLAAFFYMVLYGAFFAPRLPTSLKHTIRDWQKQPGSIDPSEVRRAGGLLGRWNPLRALVIDTLQARLSRETVERLTQSLGRDARRALDPYEAPLKIMEVIAALAPLLGLLGTVVGMIEAFGAMAATEGRANASALSGGIYKALFTTAAGLVVAIPFAALAAWAEFRLKRLHTMMNDTLVSLLSEVSAPGLADDADEAADVPASADSSRTSWKQPRENEDRLRYAAG